MTEREKLIELLDTVIFPREGADPAEVVADFLLDNGMRLTVTCSECKHWGDEEFAEGGYRVCCCEEKDYATNEPSKKYVYFPISAANDYCSYGERRGAE